MLMIKEIKNYQIVERPVISRVLKNAKCSCEIIKSPIGNHSKLTFHAFNYPKDYIKEKILELMAIAKLENRYDTTNEYAYFNNIAVSVKVKIYSFDVLPLLNNSAAAMLYMNNDNAVARFISNFLIAFEIEDMKFL